ncbi:hypothetical protein AB0I68_02170 [Streptomyces sp. NPDC050448]|uniref:hypothetical protein n=1 Tax=Streptomyces sp. NPDC050448 TaxID=3155404 RepID=UPI003426F85D
MSALRGGRLRRAMAVAFGAVLMAGVVPAYAPTAAADTAAAPAPTETQKALKAAAKSGKPVELLAERGEFTTTYANPDGKSLRLDQSVVPVPVPVPVRVKAKGGDWVVPDATLEIRPDGTIGPKAAVAGLSFSGGGDQANLVTIARGPHSMSLGWQGRLPVPVLEGDSAVYTEVPGIDLRMTATTEGFREVLIVKTPDIRIGRAQPPREPICRARGARCPAAASLASLAVSRARRSSAEPLCADVSALPACAGAAIAPFAGADVVAGEGSWSCAGMGTDLRQGVGEEERWLRGDPGGRRVREPCAWAVGRGRLTWSAMVITGGA